MPRLPIIMHLVLLINKWDILLTPQDAFFCRLPLSEREASKEQQKRTEPNVALRSQGSLSDNLQLCTLKCNVYIT